MPCIGSFFLSLQPISLLNILSLSIVLSSTHGYATCMYFLLIVCFSSISISISTKKSYHILYRGIDSVYMMAFYHHNPEYLLQFMSCVLADVIVTDNNNGMPFFIHKYMKLFLICLCL